eukprot:scaffold11807_cov101-Isochrysis_galbana.AAC.1
MAQAANPTTEEKLSLLKKAYRSLKQESERREEAMAAERAAAQRERGARRQAGMAPRPLGPSRPCSPQAAAPPRLSLGGHPACRAPAPKGPSAMPRTSQLCGPALHAGALLSRVDELTRELESLRESVRRAGHEARERLLEDQIGRMDMAQGHPASSDEVCTVKAAMRR